MLLQNKTKVCLFSNSDYLLLVANLHKISIALFIANEIGIFGQLPSPTDPPISVADIATQIRSSKTNIENLDMILSLLSILNIIQKTGQGYAHSELSWKFLNPKSPNYLGDFIKLEEFMYKNFLKHDNLVDMVCSDYVSYLSHDEVYMKAMEPGTEFISLSIMRFLGERMQGQLLDIGGGSGGFSIHFCKKNPNLKAHIIDLPDIGKIAQGKVKQADLEDKISVTYQDILYSVPNWSYQFDYFFMARLLYLFTEKQCIEIFKKYVPFLKPNGKIRHGSESWKVRLTL